MHVTHVEDFNELSNTACAIGQPLVKEWLCQACAESKQVLEPDRLAALRRPTLFAVELSAIHDTLLSF